MRNSGIAILVAALVILTALAAALLFQSQQPSDLPDLETVVPPDTLSDAASSQDPEFNAVPQSTAERVAAGLVIIADNCSPCHATGPQGTSPHDGAPPFRDLSQRYDVSLLSEALVEGLIAHPDMPEFQFTPDSADQIIAYLQWLGGDAAE